MANPRNPSGAQDAADGSLPAITEEQRARMTFKKLLRRKRRKEREAAGEIRELNIVAMMDMMTIILVFLLKSYSATSIASAAAGDIAPPISTTREPPKDTIAVTVTRCSPSADRSCRPGSGVVLVGEKTVLTYDDDQLPASVKQGGRDGMLVLPLLEALKKEVDRQKKIVSLNPQARFEGELSVVGDRNIPYRMLTEILYTAGQAELDNYRFVVIKKEAPETGG